MCAYTKYMFLFNLLFAISVAVWPVSKLIQMLTAPVISGITLVCSNHRLEPPAGTLVTQGRHTHSSKHSEDDEYPQIQ